jgi:hypothetical protein
MFTDLGHPDINLKFLAVAALLMMAAPCASFGQFQMTTHWKNRMGYFVATSSGVAGDMGGAGGLAAANSFCLTNLSGNNWKGKDQATLVAANVKAFLCDGTTCQNLYADTYYSFALSGDTTSGGAVFVTDSQGRGPNDSANWSGVNYFNVAATPWLGRASLSNTQWDNTSFASMNCQGWTNSTGGQLGRIGAANNADSNRWSAGNGGCNNAARLICIVHPPN